MIDIRLHSRVRSAVRWIGIFPIARIHQRDAVHRHQHGRIRLGSIEVWVAPMGREVTRHPRVVDLQRQDYPRIVVWIGHHNFSTSSKLTCPDSEPGGLLTVSSLIARSALLLQT